MPMASAAGGSTGLAGIGMPGVMAAWLSVIARFPSQSLPSSPRSASMDAAATS
jgi:hypothetical protein